MGLGDIFRANDRNGRQDLSEQVEEMTLYLASWLRRRENKLRGRRGPELAPGPSDLPFDDKAIFGDMA
ncbi:MAG: hypothetical protein PVJ55_07010 [Anaerolineae bacterium]|jgi:hypothetical protein